MRLSASALCGLLAAATPALADDVGIVPTLLIAKYHSTRTIPKERFVFFARDAGAHKGTGTDVTTVSAQLHVAYEGQSSTTFVMPAGADDGTRGWAANSPFVAKYVNRAASLLDPVRVSTVKPGRTIKLQARNAGLPVSGGGPPGDVVVCYEITNAGELHRFGARWPAGTCTLSVTGTSVTGQVFTLVCKDAGVPDASCPGG